MALIEKQDRGIYVNVLNSDATLRRVVDETTPGAVRRDWESGDGKTNGTKWELVYEKVSGLITSIELFDGDYGYNLIIGLSDGEDPTIKLSLSMNSAFGEDMAKKLPNIDRTKPVVISPFSFVDENAKTRKGLSIVQDEKKIQNFFYDFHDKKNINGFPSPIFKKDKKTGEDKQFSKDDWKIYFTECRKFLIEYIEEHLLVAPTSDDVTIHPLEMAEAARRASDKHFEKPIDEINVAF